MPENKTKPTEFTVEEFIRNSDPNKIEDSFALVKIMEKIIFPNLPSFSTLAMEFATAK